MEYVDSSYIYWKSYGIMYICKGCKSYVVVHENTNIPLEILSNKEIRELKKYAH